MLGALACVACITSCTSGDKERPSPLRADSTSFKTGKLWVEYSSPAVRDRVIWGELVPYDSLWRTGANDASVFSTSVDLKIDGQALDSGTYAVFTVPGKDQWKIIFNEHWNQWGTYHYDSTLNALELVVKPTESADFSERMKFYFEDEALKFQWEKLSISLPLE